MAAKKKKGKKAFDATEHVLVPKHEICSEAEKKRVFKQYNLDESGLPRILETDAAIQSLDAEPGDVIKISRPSRTAGETVFYRVVVKA